MLDFDHEEFSCLYPQHALSLEWLETNGQGGYASSTIMNCHTRKYHGLLVANLEKPAGRHVMLSKFEDSLVLGKEEHFLSCHQYPGLFFPQPRHCLSAFENDPAPSFLYRVADMVIRKTFMLLDNEDTLLVRYTLENAPAPLLLRLRPFLAFRGFHCLTKKNPLFSGRTSDLKNGFQIQPYQDMPALSITAQRKAKFYPAPNWYLNFEYAAELARGYDWREDLFNPGILEIPLKQGESAIIAASLRIPKANLTQRWKAEHGRRLTVIEKDAALLIGFAAADQKNLRQLLQAGRQFVIRTKAGTPAIIAGYHWFGAWGRDTLIALPGLTFCSGRRQEGMAIMAALGRQEKEGLLPNFFGNDEHDPAYNTVDASLWYFWAAQQQLKHTGDLAEVKQSLWPVMKKIIRKFMSGALYNIHMADNGLLHAGSAGTHLTWMDACVGGKPVTPRSGFAVEVNALWYNALCFAGELGRAFGEEDLFPATLPDQVRQSFREIFWIAEGAYLGDAYKDGSLDRAIRPNQIFALSLPFSPLTPAQAGGVLKCLRENLLTPCGLRTLAPGDKAYRGRCEGDPAQRDSAYHQGTVWPWLLGAFGEACLRFAEDQEATRHFLLEYLRTLLPRHLQEAGLGTLSEIFDGDTPHVPRGCIAQAWSVGELIRLYFLLREE